MRIRRFTAPDSKTALAMVKAEMGADAVILANRTVPAVGGMLRQYGKTYVEVVAAMDYDLYSLSDASPETAVRPRVDTDSPARSAAAPDAPARRKPHFPKPAEPAAGPVSFPSVRKEREAVARPPVVAPPAVADPARTARPKAEEVSRWREGLVSRIRCHALDDTPATAGPRVIALVGATGVGKTTTAAKLAAWASIRQGKKVALVSMDCYRIGATDQLRTYARIMRLPCDVALRKKDLGRALGQYADRDLIIVDTAGKSPYDNRHVDELLDWFSSASSVDPFLAISAVTKKEDVSAVIDVYRPLSPKGLVLTKLDETRAYAGLCQEIVAADLPVFCLCTGQRVPEDFVPASREAVGSLFCDGWQHFVGGIAQQRAAMGWTAG